MYVMKVFAVLFVGVVSVMLCLFTPLSAQEQAPAGQPQQAAPAHLRSLGSREPLQ